jgi:hypothetical protein
VESKVPYSRLYLANQGTEAEKESAEAIRLQPGK